jgi:hypothetical protein
MSKTSTNASMNLLLLSFMRCWVYKKREIKFMPVLTTQNTTGSNIIDSQAQHTTDFQCSVC